MAAVSTSAPTLMGSQRGTRSFSLIKPKAMDEIRKQIYVSGGCYGTAAEQQPRQNQAQYLA